jgi:hypothetical protein
LGHLCLLMRFNELEVYAWCYLVQMLLLPQAEKPQNFKEIQFCSVFELLVVCALYTKTSACSSELPQSDEEDSDSAS